MKNARRPLEASETSCLLAQKMAVREPDPPVALTEAEYMELVFNTPMGWDPMAYLQHHRMMSRMVGARLP